VTAAARPRRIQFLIDARRKFLEVTAVEFKLAERRPLESLAHFIYDPRSYNFLTLMAHHFSVKPAPGYSNMAAFSELR
jgi:hypothetical protein